MEFPRQEYCSGLPCPPPGDLPDPGIKPTSPALQADSFLSEPPGKPAASCTVGFLLPDLSCHPSLQPASPGPLLSLCALPSAPPSASYTLFPAPSYLPRIYLPLFSSIFPYDPRIPNNSVFSFSIPISVSSPFVLQAVSAGFTEMLKSLVHFEVVLYMAWVKYPSPFFWRWRVNCLRIMLRSILSLLDGLGTTVKNQVTTDVWGLFLNSQSCLIVY